MTQVKRTRRITLILSWNLAYCRAMLRGVRRFAANRPEWVLTPLDPDAAPPRVLRSLEPAGVIAHAYDARLATTLRRLHCPAVNVSGVLADAGLPRVGIDEDAVGMMAAHHLLERGLRYFAFVGPARHSYSLKRASAFADTIRTRGFEVDVHFHRAGAARFETQGRPWGLDRKLQQFLARLSNPVGVLACNDIWGAQLTEACRQIGKRVPEDIAIVGVDNDDLLCELARPSLSSVAVAGEQIGYRAAVLLETLIRRKPATVLTPILVAPRAIITRQSSDLIAVTDGEVAQAVRMIRDSTTSMRVADVLSAIPVGRRSLERRFRATIGRGIWAEIRRHRVQTAQRLLTETLLPMPNVASRAGFTSAKQLSLIFRQELNTTPTRYRRNFSKHPA